nr:aminoglycoside phosphotransferase family protein [Paenibacillus xylanexedens]
MERQEDNELECMGQGRTAEIYPYADNLLLKLYRPGFSREAVETEFRISQRVYEKGLPVPRAVQLLEKDSSLGVVFERFEGSTLLSLMMQQPEELEQLSSRMAGYHYRLHRLKDESSTMPAQKNMLKYAIQRVSSFSEREQDYLINYLSRLPDMSYICHGDYHPDNVMLARDGEQYCIIDWMTGMTGDPAGDVARTWVILMSGNLPDDEAPAIREAFDRARSIMLQHYLERYIALSGITREQIEAWMLPVAAARLDESLPPSEAAQLLEFVRTRLRLLPESI